MFEVAGYFGVYIDFDPLSDAKKRVIILAYMIFHDSPELRHQHHSTHNDFYLNIM